MAFGEEQAQSTSEENLTVITAEKILEKVKEWKERCEQEQKKKELKKAVKKIKGDIFHVVQNMINN